MFNANKGGVASVPVSLTKEGVELIIMFKTIEGDTALVAEESVELVPVSLS